MQRVCFSKMEMHFLFHLTSTKVIATKIITLQSFEHLIRILHGSEVRIRNSTPRVTVWHHEALLSDAKQ